MGSIEPLRRLPIRLRLMTTFGGILAVVLASAGAVLISQFRTYIDGATGSELTDHGAGFPPGLIDPAFERFTRGHTAQPGSGAGLGLAIVAVIAQLTEVRWARGTCRPVGRMSGSRFRPLTIARRRAGGRTPRTRPPARRRQRSRRPGATRRAHAPGSRSGSAAARRR